MISDENKSFLKEKFNIDCELYNQKQLNKILDNIIKIVDDEIINKIKNIKIKNMEIFNLLNK